MAVGHGAVGTTNQLLSSITSPLIINFPTGSMGRSKTAGLQRSSAEATTDRLHFATGIRLVLVKAVTSFPILLMRILFTVGAPEGTCIGGTDALVRCKMCHQV